MEILQLNYFCHAARCENFSKTAKFYNVPTSNISRAIRAIESEIGVKLFDRTANTIILNERGKMFYKSVREALDLLENAKKDVSKDDTFTNVEIKLLLSTCRRIATQAIGQCIKQFPGMKFSVKHGIDTANYDFVISDVPPSHKNYRKIHLTTERMLLAVHENSPISKSKSILKDIENESFISLGKGTRLHTMTEQCCNFCGFTPNITIQTDDPYYVRKYLEMGLGVAVFPEKSWANMMSPEIKLIDIGFPTRKIYVFFEETKRLSQAEEKFLKILAEAFGAC